MTIKEAFDVLSPSCRVRSEALNRLRRKGMNEAIKYLKQYVQFTDYNKELLERLMKINTKDWNVNV